MNSHDRAGDRPTRVDPVRACWAFFARHRVQVWLDPAGDNAVRAAPEPHDGVRWRVEVQGWPNLVHELAHVLQAGVLDEDSGFEYHRVPLDLRSPLGRGYLWDELSACALSCAWARDPKAPGSARRRRAWFREQVEILPVFFGDEAVPERFVSEVDRCLREHAAELAWVQARLWALAERVVLRANEVPAVAPLCFPGRSSAQYWMVQPPDQRPWSPGMRPVTGPMAVPSLWAEYRATTSSV